VRGKGTNTRYVTNILPEDDSRRRLAAGGGGDHAKRPHVVSYPPHKHDRDDLPNESYLEETYYHRLNPPQGFAFQRVYTTRWRTARANVSTRRWRSRTATSTLVPKGYHPCATIHGYDLYYLNVMAGPKRTWKFHNAAASTNG
jgi:5-deoxy-glucuronate isomerase